MNTSPSMGSPAPIKSPTPAGGEAGERAEKWLVVYEGERKYQWLGSYLDSEQELEEYLSGSLKYEDRELEIDEIIDALKKAVSVRTKGPLIIIHFVE